MYFKKRGLQLYCEMDLWNKIWKANVLLIYWDSNGPCRQFKKLQKHVASPLCYRAWWFLFPRNSVITRVRFQKQKKQKKKCFFASPKTIFIFIFYFNITTFISISLTRLKRMVPDTTFISSSSHSPLDIVACFFDFSRNALLNHYCTKISLTVLC